MQVRQNAVRRSPCPGRRPAESIGTSQFTPAHAPLPGYAFGDIAIRPPNARGHEAMQLKQVDGARAAAPLRPLPAPAAVQGAPIQRQTPWWKKALIGAGIVGGGALAVAGAVAASPLMALGGAALALGSGYAAHKTYKASQTKLSITPDQGTYAHMQQTMGGDPKIDFNRGKITSRYNAQQLIEQYPDLHWQIPLDEQADEMGARNKAPRQIPVGAGARRKFDAAFSPPGVFEASEAAAADRLNRARQQANNFNYDALDARRSPQIVQQDRQALQNAPDHQTAMANLLSQHPGVTLGEDHNNPATRAFLHGQLPHLAANGVNTLYLEHFRDDHQAHVDEYLASGQMPAELDRYVHNQDRKRNPGHQHLRDLLTGARANSMRVRGIDSQTAAWPDNDRGEGGPIRDATMNNVAHQVITGDTAARQGGKYAILTGRAHNNTQQMSQFGADMGFRHGAVGLSQLLEIPALALDPHGNPELDEEDPNNR